MTSLPIAMRPLLLATDLLPGSGCALEVAANLALHLGSEVLVLHVDAEPASAPLTNGARERRAHARAQLERSCDALGRRDVPARLLIRPGDPASEILRVAATHGVSAIVLCTHGDAGARSGIGHTAERIVRDATLPVVLVPEGDPGAARVA